MKGLPGLEINQPESKVDELHQNSKRDKLEKIGNGGQGWDD
jgi:hypothetical protein